MYGRILSKLSKNDCVERNYLKDQDAQKEFVKNKIIPGKNGVNGDDCQKILEKNGFHIENVSSAELAHVSNGEKRLFITNNETPGHMCVGEKGPDGVWRDQNGNHIFKEGHEVHQAVTKDQAIGKLQSDLRGINVGGGTNKSIKSDNSQRQTTEIQEDIGQNTVDTIETINRLLDNTENEVAITRMKHFDKIHNKSIPNGEFHEDQVVGFEITTKDKQKTSIRIDMDSSDTPRLHFNIEHEGKKYAHNFTGMDPLDKFKKMVKAINDNGTLVGRPANLNNTLPDKAQDKEGNNTNIDKYTAKQARTLSAPIINHFRQEVKSWIDSLS